MRKQAPEDRYTELRERESRELMHDDEADPEATVEHETSGRQVSGHLQDGLAKQFLDKPGIPMPPIPRFRATLCCRWLLLVFLLIALVHWLGRFMTVQAFHDITHVKHLELEVDNCDVEMAPLPPKLKKGAVTIQYWKFMSQIHRISNEEDKMTIQVDMRVKVPMFRCLISIFTNHSSLDKISGHIGGTQHCRLMMMEAISKEVQLVSQQVTMQFEALPQKVHLESSQGLVAIRPKTVPEDWDATIKADHANVLVEVPSSFSLDLAGESEKHTVLAGEKVHTATPGQYQMHGGPKNGKLKFELVTEAAGYVKAGDAVVPKHVVTGSGHAEPNFFNASVAELRALTEWIERRADGVAPWVARVHLNGPNLPKGSWEVLSSEAFLTVPLQWYVLLSAGTLRPKVSEVHLHPMGMNAWPQKPESNATKRKKKALADDTLMREFNMLKPFVEKPTAAGATLAWVPHEGRPIVFTKATNKWSHAELSYTQVNILMLLIAVTFNIVVSVLVAAYVINWLQTNADFQQELKEAAVTIASSHRIGKLSGKVNSSWRIIAAHVEQPDQGVILRWRKRTGVQSSAYLCVKAKADPDPARGLDGDEICINMAVQERVDMKAESNIIIEFFFSASGSKGYPPEGGYEPTGKDLKCQYSYRFQVEGYNNNEELVAVSDWSNEVYIKPRSSVFDVPSRILQVNCAVPTDSLEFFVEHFAQFNIEGKHPQHLVILSDIKVCYHKNWRDFRDFSSDFLLTAWMGETSARCERETRAGTCRSFDKTGIFRPPDDVVQGDVDDEEDKRTQELNQVVPGRPTLCVGGADRKLCDLFVTLRKSSGEDVAEGKLEWDDLIEAFDKYEQSNDISEDQSIFVELATDKVEGEFDEEWLVWVEARVTFKNELDPKCVEMPYHKRIFQLDPPGQIFYEGMERFMAWDSSSLAQSQHGDEDMKSFDVYMTYPENYDLDPLLLAENVQVTNGGVSVMITFPESINANHVVCQLKVEGFNERGENVKARSSLEGEELPCVSHRFIVCRTWTLADFELMYASFCRMNNMEMERVTEDALQEYGMVLAKDQLKVCSGLRKPLIFEEIADQEVIDCPGLIMVSGDNISARSALGPAVDLTGGGSDAGGSILRTISSSKTPFLGGSTASPSGRGRSTAQVDVLEKREYRSTFQSVGFLENAWPRYPHALDMAYGTGWMPSFLLLNSFYPVDNILNGIKAGANALALPVAYDTVRAIGGRAFADTLLRVGTAPLYGLVPYCCEAFLHLLQMFSFLMLPFLLLFFGMCYEFVGMFFAVNPEEYSTDSRAQSHIPDMTFSAVVSGHTVEDWMKGLSSVSFVALIGSSVTAMTMIALICESNFLRNLPPPAFQHGFHQLMNGMGSMLVSSYVWVILSFAISSVLWFAMVVVIYPEQMLTALACAGGLAAVFTTMLTGLKNTKDELERMLHEEIPEVLELVCDTFLDQYDKISSGSSKRVIATYRKLEEELAERTHAYVKHRLENNSLIKQDVLGDEKKLPKEALGCLFTRALVKSKLWKEILHQEQHEDEHQNPEDVVQTTDTVLESLGLPQEDTTKMHYLDLRMRLEDKEREEGGENIHKYGPDLQQKLMKVYVRMQDVHMETPSDVNEALSNPKRLAKCMHRANLAKFKTLEHPKEAGSKSSLQICIQSLNEEQVDQVDLYLVEHLDDTLSQVDISELVTPFVETTIPVEVQKQVRFALDMTRQDSSAQQLYDQLRRKKNSIPRRQVKQRLTLNRQNDPDGLMSFLADIGVVERTAQRRNAAHYNGLFHRVEGLVSDWKREDEEGHDVKDPIVDPRDLEGFVHELLKHRIWWGAMESILKNIGFPMTVDGSGNSVSRDVVMKEFESMSVKDGFLPSDKILDFLRKVTRADIADGAAGRLWKGEMVMLMQHLKICGFVGKQVRSQSGKDKKKNRSAHGEDIDIADDGLPEMALQEWPEWMVRAWDRVAPALPSNESARPFLPRTLIYKFIKEIAFAREENVRNFKEKESETYEKLKIVDEEYDSWKKEEGEGPKYLWVNRGKSLLRVRAIWQECFLDLLTKVHNPVQDMKEGLLLFNSALQDQRNQYHGDLKDMEGLLAVDFLHTWLQKNLVERTSEVSLQIFKSALHMAEFTLPPSSVEALWYSADKAQMVGSKSMERASLRQVKDLEDRLVMYLSGGMFYESLRGLIVNELHVPSLHSLDAKEIAAAFKQVDEKTGCCGVIDPHEVSELLLLLSQEGMDLTVVQQSFDQLRVHLDPEAVQDAFMMVDTNCDDKIDLTEFLSLIDRMVDTMIPDAIFEYMGLQRHQIFWGVILKVVTILTMFLFVFVSLNAFHVDVGEKAASAGSSSIRAALAGLALLGLRNDNSPEYMEKQANIAKEQLYRITSVSRSQLEARRRSVALNAGARMARKSAGNVTLGGGTTTKNEEEEEEADAD